MLDARSLAAALNGEVAGPDRVVAPGPGHGVKDRSLSVRLVPDAPEWFFGLFIRRRRLARVP
jgi:hypothetical protein